MSSFRSMGCEVVAPRRSPRRRRAGALRRARPPLQPLHPELGAEPRQRPPLWRRVRLRGHRVDALPAHSTPPAPPAAWSPRPSVALSSPPATTAISRTCPPTEPPPSRSPWRPVARDRLAAGANASCAPRRSSLDLNGVVKGRTVDDALALLGAGWVSAGRRPRHDHVRSASGYLAVGRSPSTSGGLATSSVARTQLAAAAACVQHHLIDPATGRPARTPWRDVTVAAGSCLAADVAAKAALLLGAAGPSWLDRARPRRPLRRHRRRRERQRELARGAPGDALRGMSPARLVLRALGGDRRVPAALGLGASLGLLMSGRVSLSWPRFAVEERAPLPRRSSPAVFVGAAWRLAAPRPRRSDLARPDARPVHVAVPAARRRARDHRRRADGGGRGDEPASRPPATDRSGGAPTT